MKIKTENKIKIIISRLFRYFHLKEYIFTDK